MRTSILVLSENQCTRFTVPRGTEIGGAIAHSCYTRNMIACRYAVMCVESARVIEACE